MSQRFREPEPENKPAVHPIWNGIGCLLIVIVPIISFTIAHMLVEAQIPQDYIPLTPDLAQRIEVPGFGRIYLYYTLVITLIVTVAVGAIVTVLYSIIFSMARPRKYGPLDAPPIKRKTKKSR